MATYFYVAADDNRNIVTGVTRNLAGAMAIHRSGNEKTTASRLVFARAFDSLHGALEYESDFMRLSPRKRDRLISTVNPYWEDWSEDLFPAIAGAAAESETLDYWLDEGDEPGGLGARLQNSPTDPTRHLSGSSAQEWPEEGQTNWTAVN
ncbi:MAG: hypothetical protein JSS66_17960 [Armatimonadetes bacterium]|nr:hypothetical protein [Armatimonadota bacterium]